MFVYTFLHVQMRRIAIDARVNKAKVNAVRETNESANSEGRDVEDA
jgi:hypothetical protein